MTLTSSRISDEFELVQEILALAPALNRPFKLYGMTLTIIPDFGSTDFGSTLCKIEERGNTFALPIRHAVKYILRRYW